MLIEREENKTCEREGGEKREEKKLFRTAQDKEAISYTYRHIMRPAKLLTRSPMYVTRHTCLFSDHMPKHTLLILMRTHKTYTCYSYPPLFWSCWTFSACTSLARPPHLLPISSFPKPHPTPKGGQTPLEESKTTDRTLKKNNNIKTECSAKYFFFSSNKNGGFGAFTAPGCFACGAENDLNTRPSHDSRCIAGEASACNARFMQNSELNAVQKIQTHIYIYMYVYMRDIPVIIVFFCLLVSPVCVLACANMHHVKPPVFPVALSFCFPSVIPLSLVLSPPLYLSLCLSPPCCKKILYTDTWGLHQTEGKTE